MKLGILFNGFVAAALAVPIGRFLLSSITRGRANGYLSWVPLGPVSRISRRRDAAGHFPQSFRDADRRQDGGHGLLGAARRGRAVPGLRHQLRAPRAARFAGFRSPAVHVPVPRRRLLPRRLARLRTAGARPVRISVQGRERRDHDSGRRAAHAGAERGTASEREPPCA